LIRGRHQRLTEIRAEHDRRLAALNQVVSEKGERIAELNQAVVERNGRIATLNQAVAERNQAVAERNQAVAERNGRITELNREIIKRDGLIAELNTSFTAVQISDTEKDRQIRELSRVVERLKDSDARVAEILNSKSWRLTEPLRTFRRYLPGKLRRLNEGAASHSASGPAGPGDRQGSAVIADSDSMLNSIARRIRIFAARIPTFIISEMEKRGTPSLRP